ncbi:MAG TPA: G-D-S-L family lipolytic protein, partial [Allocoleopsis sp.]
ELNETIKNLTNKFLFKYIDLYSAFLDSNGDLDKLYTNDGVHLKKEGYLVWKRIVEKDVIN